MVSIVLTIIILGVLIIVHEAGHFLVARWRGVRVERFSVGFGPKIWGFKRGDTEYLLSAIPLGGYVKMAGDDPEATKGKPDEFLAKPLGDRFLIILAGPVANLALGFAFFFCAGLFGRDYFPGNTVAAVREGSPASEAGLMAGDKIISVNGRPFRDWGDTPAGRARIGVLRGQDTIFVDIRSLDGAEPYISPVLGKLVPGEPAERAGFMQGDTVLAVDSVPVQTWGQMVQYIRERPDQEIAFTLKRGQDTIRLSVKTRTESTIEDGKEKSIGIIGVLAPTKRKSVSIPDAARDAMAETLYAAGFIFLILVKIITGGISPGSIGGPLMIGKAVGQSWALGAERLLATAGLISVNLCVVNLLPIPALDGGHLTIFSLEGIIRRKIPPKWHTRIQLAGLILVGVLMVAVTLMDIRKLFLR
ncbi:MAG: RIP metalloprotease RseP [candidate division WOR-3 bacterium]